MDRARTGVVLVVLAALGAGVWWVFRTPESTRKQTESSPKEPSKEPEAGTFAGNMKSMPPSPEAGVRSKKGSLLQAYREIFGTISVPEGHAVILGRVVSREANPGASQLVAEQRPLAGAAAAVHFLGQDGVIDPAPRTQSQTRTDGWFLVTVEQGSGHRVVISAPKFGSATRDLAPVDIEGEGTDLGTIELLPLIGVTVRVTAGMETLLEPLTALPGMKIVASLTADGDPLAEGTTDDKGELNISGLPVGDVYFRGELAPYATFQESRRLLDEGQTETFNVQAVGKVKVRVMSEGGGVLRRFSLSLDIRRDNYGWMMPVFTEEIEPKDEEGWHTIEDVKVGDYDLYATAPRFALGQTGPVKVEPAQTSEVTVTVPRGYRVRGRVLSKKDGTPVPGATVYSLKDLIPSSVDPNSQTHRPMARATKTNGGGDFQLEDLTEGSHQLSAHHENFAAITEEQVVVGKDVPNEKVELKLPVGASLIGHCYDANGSPSPGDDIIVLQILDSANIKKKVPYMTKTDESGFYRIDHLPLGMQGAVRTRAPAKKTSTDAPYEMKFVTLKDSQETRLDWGKPGEGTIVFGRVVDAAGAPAAGVTVQLMAPMESGSLPEMFSAAANAEGLYEIKAVKKGNYVVQIGRAAKGSEFTGVDQLTVPEGGRVQKDITLRGGSMRGQVLDKTTNKPISIGDVVLGRSSKEAPFEFVGRCDVRADGTFGLDNIPAGTYSISVASKGYTSATLEKVVIEDMNTKDVGVIRLDSGGRIIGTVLDPQGTPVGGAAIFLVDPATQQQHEAWAFNSAPDGSYQAISVPVGTYGITARKSGLTFDVFPVTVTAGNATTATIRARE